MVNSKTLVKELLYRAYDANLIKSNYAWGYPTIPEMEDKCGPLVVKIMRSYDHVPPHSWSMSIFVNLFYTVLGSMKLMDTDWDTFNSVDLVDYFAKENGIDLIKDTVYEFIGVDSWSAEADELFRHILFISIPYLLVEGKTEFEIDPSELEEYNAEALGAMFTFAMVYAIDYLQLFG